MEQQEAEEVERALMNYKSPKGRLIRQLEQKIKKPEIDDTLGKILDEFSRLTKEQSTFLENGIYTVNFAEDALLLQSCGQYYAKRVDKLWDELLQFHTRMVSYDRNSIKNCTDSQKEARKDEIARLEERLNRGKRKKIVLETDTDVEAATNDDIDFVDYDPDCWMELFDTSICPIPEGYQLPDELPIELESELSDEWEELNRSVLEERKRNFNSFLVARYHKMQYRFKHYETADPDRLIYWPNDPEGNCVREGDLISYHYIKQLFEDNDNCLMPDENLVIAKLRLAHHLKKNWLLKNQINPEAPFDTYKDAWRKYVKEFFEHEKRKIQNMPQRNPEETIKFYKALARKELIAKRKLLELREQGVENLPGLTFESVIVEPAKDGYQGIFDPYVPEEDDSLVVDLTADLPPHPSDGDHEAELTTLLADLPSTSEATENLRSDSGYFDGGFEGDDETDRDDRSDYPGGTDTPFEFDKVNPDEENASLNPLEKSTDLEKDNAEMEVVSSLSEEQHTQEAADTLLNETNNEPESGPAESEENASPTLEYPFTTVPDSQRSNSGYLVEESAVNRISTDDKDNMNNAIKEFIRQAAGDEESLYRVLEDSYFEKTDSMVTLIYDKSYESEQMEKKKEEPSAKTRQPKKSKEEVKNKTKDMRLKRPLEQHSNDDPPPKRRKLSRKQVEVLKRGLLVTPVSEQKWDYFVSLNYQVEAGEGEIAPIEYESELENDLYDDTHENDDFDISERHSEFNESHVNDSECRPESTPLPLTQDSGISMNSNSDSVVDTQENHSASTIGDFQSLLPEQHTHLHLENIDHVAEMLRSHGASLDPIETTEPEKVDRELSPQEKERKESAERVNEWKDYIVPKLDNLKEKDFDIHEYGSNIINGMSLNEQKPFSEFVRSQSSAEVVRYFISALQLANTMNVEICGSRRGELSNDTFTLKLLSKERYHEHLLEFQAPSEETLTDKLKRIREIQVQGESSIKRKIFSDNLQHQSIKKVSRSATTRNLPASAKASKRIKILNDQIVRAGNQESSALPNTTIDQQNFDFQEPSTSRQADLIDQQRYINSTISYMAHAPPRVSTDSGFMPSCDEDFLEQFDKLQQTSNTHLSSTPKKPGKISKIVPAQNK